MDPAGLHLPEWVVPSVWEVRDAMLLALDLSEDELGMSSLTDLTYARTVVTTCSWVSGAGPAPLTGAPAGSVTRRALVSELRTELPGDVGRAARSAAYDTGMWLLGPLRGDSTPPQPPVEVPPRHADGRVLTADEMFAYLVEHDPHGVTRGQRRSMLARLREEEQSWHRTAELVEHIARRFAARRSARSA